MLVYIFWTTDCFTCSCWVWLCASSIQHVECTCVPGYLDTWIPDTRYLIPDTWYMVGNLYMIGRPPKLAGWLARPPWMCGLHTLHVRYPPWLCSPPCIRYPVMRYQVSGAHWYISKMGQTSVTKNQLSRTPSTYNMYAKTWKLQTQTCVKRFNVVVHLSFDLNVLECVMPPVCHTYATLMPPLVPQLSILASVCYMCVAVLA